MAMPHPRPFRFGVTAGSAGSVQEWRSLARRAEDLGYSSLLVPDHFNDQFAPIPALATAAAVTKDLRLGTLVLANDFKHPAVVAKEIATLDLFSEGRVEWGMGAGWFPPDYQSTGIAFDRPAVRVDRLIEAVQLMKELFNGTPVSHAGRHYTTRDLVATPSPVQRPHPPLIIGGAQRRILSFAGREADIVSVNPSPASQPVASSLAGLSVVEATDRQIDWIRKAAGPRYTDVVIQMVAFPALVVDNAGERIEKLARNQRRDPAEVRAAAHVLIGSASEICDALEERRARWDVSYWIVAGGAAKKFAPVVERLAGR